MKRNVFVRGHQNREKREILYKFAKVKIAKFRINRQISNCHASSSLRDGMRGGSTVLNNTNTNILQAARLFKELKNLRSEEADDVILYPRNEQGMIAQRIHIHTNNSSQS